MDYLLNETLKDDLYWYFSVLNLIINGLPSKQREFAESIMNDLLEF